MTTQLPIPPTYPLGWAIDRAAARVGNTVLPLGSTLDLPPQSPAVVNYALAGAPKTGVDGTYLYVEGGMSLTLPGLGQTEQHYDHVWHQVEQDMVLLYDGLTWYIFQRSDPASGHYESNNSPGPDPTVATWGGFPDLGWELPGPTIAVSENEPPEGAATAYVIAGAGTAELNGTVEWVGRFVILGEVLWWQNADGTIALHRNSYHEWFITPLPTEGSYPYYMALSETDSPPASGWSAAGTAVSPAPTVTPLT